MADAMTFLLYDLDKKHVFQFVHSPEEGVLVTTDSDESECQGIWNIVEDM